MVEGGKNWNGTELREEKVPLRSRCHAIVYPRTLCNSDAKVLRRRWYGGAEAGVDFARRYLCVRDALRVESLHSRLQMLAAGRVPQRPQVRAQGQKVALHGKADVERG